MQEDSSKNQKEIAQCEYPERNGTTKTSVVVYSNDDDNVLGEVDNDCDDGGDDDDHNDYDAYRQDFVVDVAVCCKNADVVGKRASEREVKLGSVDVSYLSVQ